MPNPLEKYLKKLGVKSYLDLNTEERETYKQWETALQGRRITDDDVKQFFAAEIDEVLNKLPEQRLGSKDDTFLKVKLEFLRKVQGFLLGPERERIATALGIERLVDTLPS